MKKIAVMTMALAGFAAAPAMAQQTAALVEDVSAGVAGVEALDYVSAGQTITLGAGRTLVLSYLGSCRRETIKGGTVVVGPTQSTVTDGQVETQTMKCDRAALRLASAQASQSGAAAIRVAVDLARSDFSAEIDRNMSRLTATLSQPAPAPAEGASE
jgi:hypothetical protein